MAEYFDQVSEAANAVRQRLPDVPRMAIVLGSGLGGFADTVEHAVSVPYRQLPHWPVSSVPGHEGRLVVGAVRGRPVAVLSGRCHAYEGYPLRTVTFATRVLGLLGVMTLILTNAAGAVKAGLARGSFMVIDDHINLGGNPLAGPHDERLGPRFPDMSEVYSVRLRRVADEAARALGLTVAHGVYASLTGPSYETPAEIRYLRVIGADAVGMSTVPEALVARHMGMEVLGISCMTNAGAGQGPGPIDHQDVLETTRSARGSFSSFLEEILDRI